MIGSLTRSSLANKKQYRSLLAGNEPVSYGAYELISTTVLSSAADAITFTSSGAWTGYKHLQIRAVVGQSGGDVGYMRFNGDTAANYATHEMYGQGSFVTSQNWTDMDSIFYGTNFGNASAWSPVVVDVLDFQGTKNKTIRSFNGNQLAPRVALVSGLWRSTAALTSMSFISTPGSTFRVGTRFSLYGIK